MANMNLLRNNRLINRSGTSHTYEEIENLFEDDLDLEYKTQINYLAKNLYKLTRSIYKLKL